METRPGYTVGRADRVRHTGGVLRHLVLLQHLQRDTRQKYPIWVQLPGQVLPDPHRPALPALRRVGHVPLRAWSGGHQYHRHLDCGCDTGHAAGHRHRGGAAVGKLARVQDSHRLYRVLPKRAAAGAAIFLVLHHSRAAPRARRLRSSRRLLHQQRGAVPALAHSSQSRRRTYMVSRVGSFR